MQTIPPADLSFALSEPQSLPFARLPPRLPATWRRLAAVSKATCYSVSSALAPSSGVLSAYLCCRGFMLRAGAAGAVRTLAGGPPRRALTLVARGMVHSPGGAGSSTTLLARQSSMEAFEVQQNPPELVPQAEAAWAWFNEMGAPKFWVRTCKLVQSGGSGAKCCLPPLRRCRHSLLPAACVQSRCLEGVAYCMAQHRLTRRVYPACCSCHAQPRAVCLPLPAEPCCGAALRAALPRPCAGGPHGGPERAGLPPAVPAARRHGRLHAHAARPPLPGDPRLPRRALHHRHAGGRRLPARGGTPAFSPLSPPCSVPVVEHCLHCPPAAPCCAHAS